MKAYLILDLAITDLEKFNKYILEIPAFISKHLGKYLVRGVVPTVVEGDWTPERVVVIEFPTKENAENFLNDPEAQPLFELRHNTTTSKLILAESE